MPIYLLQNKTKNRVDLVSQKRSGGAESFSNRVYSVESLHKAKNKNNNHATKHHNHGSSSSLSSINSNRDYSDEALAQITDLEYNFEYDLDGLTASSTEKNSKPPVNHSKKKSSKLLPQSKTQTKFKPINSSYSDNRWSISNFLNSLKSPIKFRTSTEIFKSSSSSSEKSNHLLDFSFNFTYVMNWFHENLNLKSLSKREKKFFNFLLNLLIVLLLVLVLLYYFLSLICSSWNIASKVKIENENIYIKL